MGRIILAGTIVLAITLLYFFFDARVVTFLPRCPFKYLTGLLCPGCGSQRALSALLHGDAFEAARFNILLVACVPLMLYAATIAIYNQLSTAQLRQPIFYTNTFVRIVLAVVILFWILRNIETYPFTMLAPPR